MRPSASFCIADNIIKSFVKLFNAVFSIYSAISPKCNSNLSISRVNCGNGTITSKTVIGQLSINCYAHIFPAASNIIKLQELRRSNAATNRTSIRNICYKINNAICRSRWSINLDNLQIPRRIKIRLWDWRNSQLCNFLLYGITTRSIITRFNGHDNAKVIRCFAAPISSVI